MRVRVLGTYEVMFVGVALCEGLHHVDSKKKCEGRSQQTAFICQGVNYL